MAATAFRLEKTGRGDFWFLTFDLPGEKVNKLSEAVMREFEQVLVSLEAKPGFAPGGTDRIAALILRSGKRGNFIAGADIDMIQATQNAAQAQALSAGGQALMNRWEDLPFPTIAAIDGAALGGGCEFALACRALVMSDDAARIGLPEVLLGLVPGMGGCVRLPRKLGLAQAFDLILTGKTLNGERAYKAGLADAVIPAQDFEGSVLNWVERNLSSLNGGLRLAREPRLGGTGGAMGSLLEKTPVGRMVVFNKARGGVMAQTKGNYPAPLAAIEVLKKTGASYGPKLKGRPRDKALAVEAEAFGKLAATDVSKNLIRLFFLTEAVKKTNGVAGGASVAQKVSSAGVLGAGVMGGGIAQLFAEKGILARMKDLNAAALGLGIQAANKIFLSQVRKRRISRREALQKLNFIAPALDFAGFKSVDVVVEAIVENMDIKKKVLADLENHVSPTCVIASNTSSLSISEMQKAFANPDRFAGMHFFNPVHRMPLVEVIRGDKSSDAAVATVFELSKKLGKTPIVVKDAPGFLVNRLLAPYLNEATYVLADGAPVSEIDSALVTFGMPMGPIELIDEVGVDVAEKVAHILNDAFGARMTACPLNSKISGAQRLGKKNGKGFYLYDPKTRKRQDDDGIYALMGLTPRPGAVAAPEIVERCILPMINEAARCLEEGVVATASDVDLGMIMGTGFPPFRGGLLRYADSLGVDAVVEKLKGYQARFGARYEPAAALLARQRAKQRFYP